MTSNRHFYGRFLVMLGLLLGADFSSSIFAENEKSFVAKSLIFAKTFRTTDGRGQTNDFVLLGHYDFLNARKVRLSQFLYDGRANRQPGSATKTINVRVALPNQAAPATAPPVRIPSYSKFKQFVGTWEHEKNVIRVWIGKVIHEWRLQDAKSDYYVMHRPYYHSDTGSTRLGGLDYSHFAGFGYLGGNPVSKKKLTKQNLKASYKGVNYASPSKGSPQSKWKWTSTSLSSQVLKTYGDSEVLTYAYPSKSKQGMWAHSTLLLNYAPYSTQLLYLQAGHDHNRNGVFDEAGHVKQVLALREGNVITKMVYVEHSHEAHGYPILGIGRYH